MDVVDAIMRIFSDIFVLNGIPLGTSDMITGMMSGFFKGIVAFVQLIQNMYEALGAL